MSLTSCKLLSNFWNNNGNNNTYNVDTPDGSCLKIESEYPSPLFVDTTWNQVKSYIFEDLTLIPGIGPVRYQKLKMKGIRSIKDLFNTKWKKDAEIIESIIEEGSISEIFGLYSSLHRNIDPRLLLLVNSKDITFFDIETFGMWNAPIILFGCGKYTGESIKVIQYLARNLDEEYPALLQSAKILNSSSTIVTYNGKIFDVPYINGRLIYYGETPLSFDMHMDLLPYSRRIFQNKLVNCRLETVENAIPSLNRGEDVPGALVPYYYSQYLSTGRKEILYPIMDHNRIDVANLAYLLNYNQQYAKSHYL